MLVDEYQDTNRAQYMLVKQLTDSHRNLCVVGDSDQSIYKFRGADIRNIRDFEKDYPRCPSHRLGPELPVNGNNPRRCELGDFEQHGPDTEASLVRPGNWQPHRSLRSRGRTRRGWVRGR